MAESELKGIDGEEVPPTAKVTVTRSFEIKNSYGQWEVILNNPNAKRLTFLMVGDRQRGFIPSAKMFNEAAEKIDAALTSNSKGPILITHPFISVMQVDLPEGPVLVTTPKPKDAAVPETILEKPEHLRTIRDMAEQKAAIKGTNSLWVRAYQDVATAADHLEAMIRRTMVQELADKEVAKIKDK